MRLRHELQKRELDPFINRTDFWWMAWDESPTVFVNNWNPWCNANALLCYMLLENDRDKLAKAVYKSMISVDRYLNYVKADGACEEGATYWGHAFGKLFDYLSELQMITGGKVSLFNNKLVKDMGEFVAKSYIGNGYAVNFADASAHVSNYMALVYRCGKALGSREMMDMAVDCFKEKPESVPSVWLDTYKQIEALKVLKEMSQAKGGYKADAFTWYPQTEFCYMRNAEAFFAGKGGYNDESHNHNDIGSFVLYYDNTPIMIDAGVGTYTRQTFSSERYSIWTMQGNYHNIPMINGVPEKYGKKYKATNARADRRSMSFSVELASAYPKEACVESWVRSYQLKKGKLTVSDNFKLSQAKAVNIVNFLTWGDIDISKKGVVNISVKGVKAQLSYDANTFEPSIETIALTDKRLSDVWGNKIYRLSLKAKTTAKSGIYKYDITKK